MFSTATTHKITGIRIEQESHGTKYDVIINEISPGKINVFHGLTCNNVTMIGNMLQVLVWLTGVKELEKALYEATPEEIEYIKTGNYKETLADILKDALEREKT